MSTLQKDSIPLISAEDAKELLRPYLDTIRECIAGGWSAWKQLGELKPELQVPLSKRTRASFVYDHIIGLVRARIPLMQGVSIREKGGFPTLEIESGKDQAVLRFKKLDNRKRARNYQTAQQVLFSMQLKLPGWPADAARLIAGYVLDLSETGISEFCVTLPVGSGVKWDFAIEEREPRVIELPTDSGAQQLMTEVLAKGKKKAQSDDTK